MMRRLVSQNPIEILWKWENEWQWLATYNDNVFRGSIGAYNLSEQWVTPLEKWTNIQSVNKAQFFLDLSLISFTLVDAQNDSKYRVVPQQWITNNCKKITTQKQRRRSVFHILLPFSMTVEPRSCCLWRKTVVILHNRWNDQQKASSVQMWNIHIYELLFNKLEWGSVAVHAAFRTAAIVMTTIGTPHLYQMAAMLQVN